MTTSNPVIDDQDLVPQEPIPDEALEDNVLKGDDAGNVRHYIQNIGVFRIDGVNLPVKGVATKWLYFINDIGCLAIYNGDSANRIWEGANGVPVAGSNAVRDGLLPFEGQRFYSTETNTSYEYLGGSWTGTIGDPNLRAAEYVITTTSTSLAVGRKYLVAADMLTVTFPTGPEVEDGHSIYVQAIYDADTPTPIIMDGTLYDGVNNIFPIDSGTLYHFVYWSNQWYAFSSVMPTDYIEQIQADVTTKHNEVVQAASDVEQAQLDAQQVTLLHGEVVTLAGQVDTQSQQVATNTQTVTTLAQQVSADADQVALDKSTTTDAATAAALSESNASDSAILAGQEATTATNERIAAEDAANRAETAAATVTEGISFQGLWDASSGILPTPPANSSGYWWVSVAGTVNSVEYDQGDSLIYRQATNEWFKLDTNDAVKSVAGKTGVVTLGTSDITNLDAQIEELRALAILGW